LIINLLSISELVNSLIDRCHEVHVISQRDHVISERAHGHYFTTFEEYENITRELLQNKTADVVVIPNNLLFVEGRHSDFN